MIVTVTLDDDTVARLDELIADGVFPDRASALREGVERLHAGGAELALSLADLDAALAEGLEDAEAGRVSPAEEVFAELKARYRSSVPQPIR
ncbi:MAG TPA: ribbon-helix-helix protein, CopG family [Beijerinckiaceae bacterium]|jgi:antitoxin ParD1/3/4